MIEIRSKKTGNLIRTIRTEEIGIERAMKLAEKEVERWDRSEEFPEGTYIAIPLAK